MQSAQIHGICGFFGVINVGIFGAENGLIAMKGQSEIFTKLGI